MSEPNVLANPAESRLEAIAARRAARLGKSVTQMLAEDRGALRHLAYPGLECLNPQEIERFIEDLDLPSERLLHLDACPMCMALLEAAQPTENGLAHFLEQRRRIDAARTRPIEGSVRRPLIDILWVEVPSLVAVGVISIVAFTRASDATMVDLLATVAPKSLVTVFVAALVATALAVAIAKWVKVGKAGPYQRFGGAAIGGAFVAFLLMFGAKTSFDVNYAYSGLENAQEALLGAVALRHSDGRVVMGIDPSLKVTRSSDGSLLRATSASFDGTLLTRTENDGIGIFWDQGSLRSLSTIYQGTLSHSNNGQLKVMVGTKELGVEKGLQWHAAGSGTRVLALVAPDSLMASKIFPLDQMPTVEMAPPHE